MDRHEHEGVAAGAAAMARPIGSECHARAAPTKPNRSGGGQSGEVGRRAEDDSGNTLFELGLSCWTGRRGRGIDVIEAHKWLNLAAAQGYRAAAAVRADLALSMSAAEISAAQRRARAWVAAHPIRRKDSADDVTLGASSVRRIS